MAYSPEGFDSAQPSPQTEGVIDPVNEALSDLITPEFTAPQTPHGESFSSSDEPYMYEGYNLNSYKEAVTWVTLQHEKDGSGFSIPQPKGDIDRFTGRHITHQWAMVERAALHNDGRHENDAEHSAKTAMTIIEVLGRLNYPRHIIAEAVLKAITHDREEAITDDIGIYDPRRDIKPQLVVAAHTILREHDKDNPLMTQLMYETKYHLTEADLINDGFEKSQPGLQALDSKCETQKFRKDNFSGMVRKHLEGAASHKVGFDLCVGISKLIGENWHKWGCEPFDGDSDIIIEDIAAEVWAEKHPESEYVSGALEQIIARPRLSPDEVEAMGATSLDKFRARKNHPYSPPDPSTPAGLVIEFATVA